MRSKRVIRFIAVGAVAVAWVNFTTTIPFVADTDETFNRNPVPARAENETRRQHATFGGSNGKPRMFLHIGPHKSATTSIQCALQRYSSQLRKQDSMIYLGKVDAKFCGLGRKFKQDGRIRTIDKCMADATCWSEITQEWDQYRTQGMDLILSKESLSDWASSAHSHPMFRKVFWGKLEEALQGFNVTVLLTYRHYYEWLPSAFYQHAYHMRLQSGEPSWPRQQKRPQTFDDLVKGILQDRQVPPYPFLDDILQYSFPESWNVHVLDLHREADIVSSLLCHVLQAKHTCGNYQAIPPVRTSPAEELIYDSLNVQALQWGWLHSDGRNHPRMIATKRFVKQQNYNVSNFPYDCPVKSTLQSFLDRSLALESQVLVGRKSDQVAHSRAFWAFAKSLCTVNVTQVLLQDAETWKRFYKSFS